MGKKNTAAGALVALLAIGCSSPAEKVVKGYLNQKKCTDRAQFILQPEKNKAALARYYKKNKDCVTKYEGMDASDCKSTLIGHYCTVTFKKGPGAYCLKREKTGFKIDWRCSVGYSDTPLKVFKADHPKKPVLMRVWAKLADYYPDDAPRDQFISVSLKDATDDDNFFITKSRYVEATDKHLDFPPAAAFHKLLADGEAHKVMVDAVWNKGMGEPVIGWVVQNNWKALTDDELAAIEKKRDQTIDRFLHPGASDAKKLAGCCSAVAKLSDLASAMCPALEEKVRDGDTRLRAAASLVLQLKGVKKKPPEACSKLQ